MRITMVILWKLLKLIQYDGILTKVETKRRRRRCRAFTEGGSDVIVINDYNMTRDIEELYNDDKIDDSRSENDIVIDEAIETLHLMCECANIIN